MTEPEQPTFDPYIALKTMDDARPRSSSGPGPSSFFGPECQVGRDFAGFPAVNEHRVDKLAAMIGTAVHSALEQAYAGQGEHEVEVSYAGIVGHADFLPAAEPDVLVDWKTSKVGKVVTIKKDGPPIGHRAQVSFYARAAGRKLCRVVYLPKDGFRRDIHIAEFPRDDALVDEAVSLYYGLRARVIRGDIPAPERPADSWCRRFCSYYAPGTSGGPEGCPGLPRQSVPPPPSGGLFHQVT